ncbi:hypothetical protein E2C01_052935 [Portunus trituberculatus]|uniref:Uncharacterized protein n=1 Tax=Portunus trituberculatus TaxID=210409 RepID=A0A5B7GJ06_PORTR|nr:hypothetical protein [Portunus trituberculatus]
MQDLLDHLDSLQWLDVLYSDETRFTVTASSQGHLYLCPSSNSLHSSYTSVRPRRPLRRDSAFYPLSNPWSV